MRRRRNRQLPPLVLGPTPRELREQATRKLAAERQMWAFDSLPPALRRKLRCGAISADCEEARDVLLRMPYRLSGILGRVPSRDEVVQMMVAANDMAEDEAIARFAAEYLKTYGAPLPHLAAGATPLREKELPP